MSILNLFFYKRQEKPVKKAANTVLNTTRTSVAALNVQRENLESQRKEEELLNRIRKGIQETRKIRKQYHCDAMDVIKYLNDSTERLEEFIEPSAEKTYSYTNNDDCSFYRQYTAGSFVVPI